MLKTRWLLALPLALAASIGSAQASSIRDNAGMFGPAAVRQAQSTLDAIERNSQLNVSVETIDSLNGDSIERVSTRHAERQKTGGLFILLAKQEHKIEVLSSTRYRQAFPTERLKTIQKAFIDEFKKGSLDQGLIKGTETLESEVIAAKGENGGVLRSGAGVPAGRRAAVPVR
ncbi:TPM domain-containing protein, partial [Singulisphaera rosea]